MSTAIRRASDSRGGGIRGSCCMNAGRGGGRGCDYVLADKCGRARFEMKGRKEVQNRLT